MALKAVQFLALVFTALALIPGGAHLFSLPNKIGMTQEHYFVAQRVYDGWWTMGFILIPAMAINLILAVVLRAERPAFYLALAGCICLAATLVIFFTFTQPANAATQNWTVVPDGWKDLRTRWEYSHAVNAALTFFAFCFIVLVTIATRR